MKIKEYQRLELPIWVQGWLEVEEPSLVFIAKKTEAGPHLIDGNDAAKNAFHKWTGLDIPVLEEIKKHKQADLEAWEAYNNRDSKKLSSLVFYNEEIDGQTYQTIKTPISDDLIVIITRPVL